MRQAMRRHQTVAVPRCLLLHLHAAQISFLESRRYPAVCVRTRSWDDVLAWKPADSSSRSDIGQPRPGSNPPRRGNKSSPRVESLQRHGRLVGSDPDDQSVLKNKRKLSWVLISSGSLKPHPIQRRSTFVRHVTQLPRPVSRSGYPDPPGRSPA